MSVNTQSTPTMIELLSPALVNHLREGEKVLLAGMAAMPASGFVRLIGFGSSYLASHTYMIAVTNQRLLLTRTSSWTGKVTPETIQIKREVDYKTLRDVTVQGNAVILRMEADQIKLVGIKAFWGVVQTADDFLVTLVQYLKSQSTAGAGTKAAPAQQA